MSLDKTVRQTRTLLFRNLPSPAQASSFVQDLKMIRQQNKTIPWDIPEPENRATNICSKVFSQL
jgi:hypothetical protein